MNENGGNSVAINLSNLSSALRQAMVADGFAEMLEKRRNRLAIVIALARCLNAFGMGALISASINLLYYLVTCRSNRRGSPALRHQRSSDTPASAGDVEDDSTPSAKPVRTDTPPAVHQEVQSISTNIGTFATLIDFVIRPMIGNFVDSYGRLPAMVLALISTGIARLGLSMRPTLSLYCTYRVLVGAVGQTFIASSQSALGDLYGRGTAEFTEISSMVSRYALLSSIAGTHAGRKIKEPIHCFLLCATMQLGAASALTMLMQETLPHKTQMQWSLRRSSPLSFIAFFQASPALVALASLSVLRNLPAHLNIDAVYRRQRFGCAYGREQESTEMTLFMVVGFLSSFLRTRVLDFFGLRNSARLDSWLSVAREFLCALAPRTEIFYLTPFISLFRFGDEAIERCMQQEAHLLYRGQGELGAAEANMLFLPSLVMPHVFTRLYNALSLTFPAAPYVLAALLHAFAAEFGTRLAFRRLSASVRLAAAPRRS